LIEKFNELETNSKNNNVRDLYGDTNEFKKGYQHRTNFVEEEKRDLLEDSQNILKRWKNYLCLLLYVHGVNDFRQKCI